MNGHSWMPVTFLFFAGCASTPAAQTARLPVPPGAPAAQPPQAQPPAPEETRSHISVAADIRHACGISDSDAHFAYDSASIRAEDHRVLAALAGCFTNGPLRGREMRLVGHADPRGDSEYNYVLGQRRADNVKSSIASAGLAASKIATTSRGEHEARGRDEVSWMKDRRVDVVLGD